MIDTLSHLADIYSKDTGMSFRLENYNLIVVKRRAVVKADRVELPVGHIAYKPATKPGACF